MTRVKTGENMPTYIIDEHGEERIDKAPPAHVLSERNRDVVRRYEEFLHSEWWATELRKYPSFILSLIVPKLERNEVLNRFEEWLSISKDEGYTKTRAVVGSIHDADRKAVAHGNLSPTTRDALFDFIMGFAPPITYESTKGTWFGNKIRTNKKDLILVSDIIELFVEWKKDPEAQQAYEKLCQEYLDIQIPMTSERSNTQKEKRQCPTK